MTILHLTSITQFMIVAGIFLGICIGYSIKEAFKENSVPFDEEVEAISNLKV